MADLPAKGTASFLATRSTLIHLTDDLSDNRQKRKLLSCSYDKKIIYTNRTDIKYIIKGTRRTKVTELATEQGCHRPPHGENTGVNSFRLGKSVQSV